MPYDILLNRESAFQTITGFLIAFAALILGDLGQFAHRLELGVNRACCEESKHTWKVFSWKGILETNLKI